MDHQPGTLATLFSQGLEQQGLTIDALGERTKVPRSTIAALLGATEPAILPQRIYLRGFVGVLAKELALDVAEAFARFDLEYPSESKIEAVAEPKNPRLAVAVGAMLGGIGIIAVILAFVH